MREFSWSETSILRNQRCNPRSRSDSLQRKLFPVLRERTHKRKPNNHTDITTRHDDELRLPKLTEKRERIYYLSTHFPQKKKRNHECITLRTQNVERERFIMCLRTLKNVSTIDRPSSLWGTEPLGMTQRFVSSVY